MVLSHISTWTILPFTAFRLVLSFLYNWLLCPPFLQTYILDPLGTKTPKGDCLGNMINFCYSLWNIYVCLYMLSGIWPWISNAHHFDSKIWLSSLETWMSWKCHSIYTHLGMFWEFCFPGSWIQTWEDLCVVLGDDKCLILGGGVDILCSFQIFPLLSYESLNGCFHKQKARGIPRLGWLPMSESNGTFWSYPPASCQRPWVLGGDTLRWLRCE